MLCFTFYINPFDIFNSSELSESVQVSGLTFEMCQSGKLTPEVEAQFVKGIVDLEAKGVQVSRKA